MNKGKRKEEVIKENFPELEDMNKGKIPETSKGKNRSQAKDQELEWGLMFNSNSEPGRQWSKLVKILKRDYFQN